MSFKYIKIVSFLGFLLLGVNMAGLFIPLRNSNIYVEENTYFENDIILSQKELKNQINRNVGESDKAYVVRANLAVFNGIAHYWKNEGVDKYNIRVPIYENYILYAAGYLFPSKFKRYEFNNYSKAIERGVGLCSQHAMILSDVLEKNKVETKIINLPCHVVVMAQVDKSKDVWWIVDPDFGIVIKNDIYKVNKSLEIVNDHYSNAGYNSEIVNNVQNCYKEIVKIYESSKDYSGWKRYYIEKVSYILKWLIPICLIVFPFYLKSIRKYK